jgi:hypothetical protein
MFNEERGAQSQGRVQSSSEGRRGASSALSSSSEKHPQTAAATRTRTAFIGAAAARGGASFRRADAAQVCNNVGFVVVDGAFECSVAKAARQIVSERW